MIETQAQVVRTEGDYAWVKIRPHSPCGNCDPKTGCKSVAITRLFGNAQENYRVSNPIHAAPQDLVTIAVADGVLLRTALWAYGLPLLLLLLGAAIASVLMPGQELATLIGACLGFLVGFAILRRLPLSQLIASEPAIVAKFQTGQAATTCELKRTH
jgi:sigma-E factor negative regulatory protein RseC